MNLSFPLLPTLLIAFLPGGVIPKVLKAELPEPRASRFHALGAFCYAALLMPF